MIAYMPRDDRLVVQSDPVSADILSIAQRIAGLRNAATGKGKGRTHLIALTVLDDGALLWSVLGSGKAENQARNGSCPDARPYGSGV